ncbi:MAG: multiprotein bridging factor aMBF1 [Candidatus Bathyarchaeia archaeon]
MRCEVCGGRINGKPVKALIEGARLTVCSKCAKHGTIIQEEPKTPLFSLPPSKQKAKPGEAAPPPKSSPAINVGMQRIDEVSFELVDDYDVRVRQAREKMGLTHEELGKKINEKVSVLKKIETRKIKPDNKLAAKLEHALRIKLLVPASEDKVPAATVLKQPSYALTIGDLVQLERGDKEEKT